MEKRFVFIAILTLIFAYLPKKITAYDQNCYPSIFKPIQRKIEEKVIDSTSKDMIPSFLSEHRFRQTQTDNGPLVLRFSNGIKFDTRNLKDEPVFPKNL